MNDGRKLTFFGLTKTGAARLFLLLSAIAVTFLIYFVVVRVGQTHQQAAANKNAIARNERALSYICSTTSILDALVVQVRDQIDANFRNGTYARLHLPKENIIEAHRTREQYEAANLKLKANGACREALGR
jgi:hypothetical protein